MRFQILLWRLSVMFFAPTVASPAKSKIHQEDLDFYYDDDDFDPDWIANYDPFENPPCPHWTVWYGCGRTPARTKPSSTTSHPSERTTYAPGWPSTKAPGNQHLLECTPAEVKKAACLNGGKCAVVDADGRAPHCRCTEMWTGLRCEEIDEGFFGEFLSADKVEKASIAAGVVVVVIIVTVIIVYLIIRKRRKQRKQRAEANGQANGHAGKALIADIDKGTTFDDDVEKCTDV